MKQINMSIRELEKIHSMDPQTLQSYIKDMYCQGYEDAKSDNKLIVVDVDQFRDRLLKVKGISKGKSLYVTELLRECMKEVSDSDDN